MKRPGIGTRFISDEQVILAHLRYKELLDAEPPKAIYGMTAPTEETVWPYTILERLTGQPMKVCYRAMERAERRGYIECGVSLRTGWPTEKGLALLASYCTERGVAVPPELREALGDRLPWTPPAVRELVAGSAEGPPETWRE